MENKTNKPEVVKTRKKSYVQGYGLIWDVPYSVGWFTEKIDRDAFKKTDMSDVRCLSCHDQRAPLGRVKAGTLKIGFDSMGLWYECLLPDSPNGENMRVALERGDVTQSSWAFTLADGGDSWQKPHAKRPIRTLTNVAVLWEVSPVVFPSNTQATAGIKVQLVDESGLRSSDWQTTKHIDEVDLIFEALDRQMAHEAIVNQQRKIFDDFEPRFKAMAREMARDQERPLFF